MFKKTEESEWTRFSRALGGANPAPPASEERTALDDQVTINQGGQPDTAVYMEPEPVTMADEVAPPAPLSYAPAPVAAEPVRRPSLDGDETVVGEGASIDGTIRSERSIRIRGAVQGEIESSQRVVIEEPARVQARVTAEHVTVLGEVNGAIECSGRVEIAASGRVVGEVTAGRLVIQEGAFFEGHLKMTSARDGNGA